MPDHDPLARRMVLCPTWIPGDVKKNTVNWCPRFNDCVQCVQDGLLTGLIPEPAEVWAERNAGIARWLANPENCAHWYAGECCDKYYRVGDNDCITARLLAAEEATEEP